MKTCRFFPLSVAVRVFNAQQGQKRFPIRRAKSTFLSVINIDLMLLLLLSLIVSISQVQAQCLPNDRLLDLNVSRVPVGADNLRHVSYAIVDPSNTALTPTTAVLDAVNSAVQQWNKYSSKTGVVFEPAPPGRTGVINITK